MHDEIMQQWILRIYFVRPWNQKQFKCLIKINKREGNYQKTTFLKVNTACYDHTFFIIGSNY